MIKALGIVLTVFGMIGLVAGVFGIFGKNLIPLHPWALSILGLIFFTSGIGLLKRRSDSV